MEAVIILVFLFGFPLAVGWLFRVNTSFLFATILGAELLERYFKDDTILALSPFIKNETLLDYVPIAMLILPVVLTGLFLHGSLSRTRTVLETFPLLLCGIVFAAFAAPLLPSVIQDAVGEIPVGAVLLDSTQLIVGVTVFLHLLSMWFIHGRKKTNKDKRK